MYTTSTVFLEKVTRLAHTHCVVCKLNQWQVVSTCSYTAVDIQ